MKARFRLAAATAVLALVLAAAAGCATRGARTANSGVPAPVADAEWHSLVKSGRAAFLRNDFKAALPLFASAANRSRALDDPNGLAVALLDQARCLEELEIVDILAARDREASTATSVGREDSFMTERLRLLDDLRALRPDLRLSIKRRAELDVAVAGLPREWTELAEIVDRTPPDVLSPADRARLLFARIEPLDPDDPAAACDLLKECPPDDELPPSLRAWRQIMSILYCGADELETLESVVAIYREAGRADGVAFALSSDIYQSIRSPDPVHAGDMLLRGAATCHALGYVHLAASLLDRAEAVDNPAIRERTEKLRAGLRIPSTHDSAEPKGDSKP
ncbi:MAG: hypothetical protein IKQ55_01245 [Kiritimatiellae bacterium]|nr:hypothetical protein [Kiritimatiellia bacterium]